jgi:type I restriction enzyme, S subunit
MAGEWPVVPLSSLIEADRRVTYGIVQPGSHDPNGVPIVRVSDIRDGRISTQQPLRVASEIEAQFKRTRLRGGELLLTLVGTVGETAIAPPELAGWNLARAVAIVPVREDVGAYWVRAAMQTPAVRELMLARVNTTVQTTLNLADVLQLPISLPSAGDRAAIVELLRSLDDKIQLNRRMGRTLEAMSRALFKSWFIDFDPVSANAGTHRGSFTDQTEQLFPDRFGDHCIPDGWETVPLSSMIEIVSGGTPHTGNEDYWDGDIPWYSVVDAPEPGEVFVTHTERSITHRGLSDSPARLVEPGTTIISARGTVGKLAMTAVPMTFNQSCYGIRGAGGLPSRFVFCLMQDAVAGLEARSHGSVFSTITRSTFDSLHYPLFPTNVAQAFEDIVAPLFDRMRSLALESRSLCSLHEALLPKLVSGELRIRDGERAIAAA